MCKFETIDIIDVLQEYVNKVAAEYWESDITCPPKFWVSLQNESSKVPHKIILTINHNCKLSMVIFPQQDKGYSYDSLFSDMEFLYNKTM